MNNDISRNRISTVYKSMYIPPDDVKLWGQIDYNLEKLSKVPRRRPGEKHKNKKRLKRY